MLLFAGDPLYTKVQQLLTTSKLASICRQLSSFKHTGQMTNSILSVGMNVQALVSIVGL